MTNPMGDRIAGLHNAYRDITGIDVRLFPHFERLWFDAINMGLDLDGLRSVLRSRLWAVKNGKRTRSCLLLRYLIGDEGQAADLMNEIAAIKAKDRIKQINPAKADVLRATGRQFGLSTKPALSLGDVMKLAIGR